MKITVYVALVLLYVTDGFAQDQQNWPQWRGPDANSIARPGNYPVTFSSTEDLIWKVKLPGKGASTPIVWNDRIVLTSGVGEGDEGEDGVLCFDWEGRKLWQVTFVKQIPGKHPRGSGSCPSIVTNGKQLFAYFKSGTLAALDFEGNIIWKTNLQKRFGKITMDWDLGTSPVLAGGNVVVAVMHEGHSYLVALEQKTGNVAWKVARNFDCARESAQSYTTPQLITEGDQATLMVWGADHLTGHDAGTGEMTWVCGEFNPEKKALWRVIASPAVSQGIALVPYGRGRFLAGIKLGGSGDITKEARLWEKKGIGTDVATPVAIGDVAYITSFDGKIWCVNIQTGEEIWESKLPRGNGMVYSSPVLVGNKLYICREEGDVYVCEVDSTGITFLNQSTFDDYFVATPVLVRDTILLRGEKYLYRIGK